MVIRMRVVPMLVVCVVLLSSLGAGGAAASRGSSAGQAASSAAPQGTPQPSSTPATTLASPTLSTTPTPPTIPTTATILTTATPLATASVPLASTSNPGGTATASVTVTPASAATSSVTVTATNTVATRVATITATDSVALSPTITATVALTGATAVTSTISLTSTLTPITGSTPLTPTLTPITGSTPLTASTPATTTTAFATLPLAFEPNVGQADPRIKFLVHAGRSRLLLAADHAVLDLVTPTSDMTLNALRHAHRDGLVGTTAISETVLAMRWLGASSAPQAVGLDPLPGSVSYMRGPDPSGWHIGIPTYARVAYRSVYPGIDVVFHNGPQGLENDYEVAPGADPGAIRFSMDGAGPPRLDASGALKLPTANGDVAQGIPMAYQEIDGQRHAVDARYVLAGAGAVGFVVGSYDQSRPLVIDPSLGYGSYLGGSTGHDRGNGIAVDDAGAS